MYVTEAELRDQVRRPSVGARVVVPAGAKLSPSAADFVKQWQLVVDSQHQHIAPETVPATPPGGDAAVWDRESVFPVSFAGDVPTCTCCGMAVKEKPSGLTQLNAHHFAPKTHPRIRLRGQVDSLHALVLLVQRMARTDGEDELAKGLRSLAAYCRELTSAEYNERPVAPLSIGEWDSEAIHRANHDPSGVLGVDHLTIDDEDVELQHWLNMCRAKSREIEIVAMDTFPSPHHPFGASICEAFNRLSSAFYFLQLQLKAGASR